MAMTKANQTPAQRAKVTKEVLGKLKDLLRGSPAEILGNLETAAYCCRAGTVAIVKLDLVSYPAPTKTAKPAGKKK